MVEVVVVGCFGRMGGGVMEGVVEREGMSLSGVVTRKGGRGVGERVEVRGESLMVMDEVGSGDVVIDFSLRTGVVETAQRCVELDLAYVCCVTGLESADYAVLDEVSRKVPVVLAPNTSRGVNVLSALTERISGILGDYDVDIVEYHHRHKKDAPSGTALLLGEAAARGRGLDHEEVRQEAYETSGVRREEGIGYAVLRGGEIVGEHHVIFAGDRDRIELVHKSADRGIYATGAVDAALWVSGRSPGLYTMRDVLGF